MPVLKQISKILQLPTQVRRQTFFNNTSRRMCLSGFGSATICFRRLFYLSSSMCFLISLTFRRASLIFIFSAVTCLLSNTHFLGRYQRSIGDRGIASCIYMLSYSPVLFLYYFFLPLFLPASSAMSVWLMIV